MSFGTNLLMALAALLAVSGVAAAQCPECDPDGAPGTDDGSYSSVDVGAVGDTDLSVADEGSSSFWAWFSVCLTVLIDGIEHLLGVDTGVQASADGYASEDGLDLDAAVDLGTACGTAGAGDAVGDATGSPVDCAFDFDQSELGGLDGETWEAMSDLHAAGAPYVGMPVSNDAADGLDADSCVVVDVHIHSC